MASETGMGQPILLAGGAGFLGATLIRALAERGAEVHVAVRQDTAPWRLEGIEPKPLIHRCDLRDRVRVRRLVEAIRPRYVINLVRFGRETRPEDRMRMVETHVLGTERLLDAAAATGCARFIQLGSSTEYGPSDLPHDEDQRLAPTSLYGATKAASSLLGLARAHSGLLPVAVLRPFAVYGPWDRPGGLVPSAIRAALDGSPLPLTGPGLRRDWVFVDDVADACLRALDGRADGEVVNVGTGTQTANEEIVRAVEETTARSIDVRPGSLEPRPWDAPTWVASTGKAKALLGWEASAPIGEGLSRTVAWTLEGRTGGWRWNRRRALTA